MNNDSYDNYGCVRFFVVPAIAFVLWVLVVAGVL